MSDDNLEEFVEAVNKTDRPRIKKNSGTPQASLPGDGGDWAKNLAAASCWAQSGNSYFPVSDVVNSIPPGAYRCAISNTGPAGFLGDLMSNAIQGH